MKTLFSLLLAAFILVISANKTLATELKAPFATLSAPEKWVDVFKRTKPEKLDEWLYTVVIVDDGDTQVRCGDEKTVTAVLDTLKMRLNPVASHKGRKEYHNSKFAYTKTTARCPAAEKWRLKMPAIEMHYCVENEKTEAIEKAIEWLMTLPECGPSEQ